MSVFFQKVAPFLGFLALQCASLGLGLWLALDANRPLLAGLQTIGCEASCGSMSVGERDSAFDPKVEIGMLLD